MIDGFYGIYRGAVGYSTMIWVEHVELANISFSAHAGNELKKICQIPRQYYASRDLRAYFPDAVDDDRR